MVFEQVSVGHSSIVLPRNDVDLAAAFGGVEKFRLAHSKMPAKVINAVLVGARTVLVISLALATEISFKDPRVRLLGEELQTPAAKADESSYDGNEGSNLSNFVSKHWTTLSSLRFVKVDLITIYPLAGRWDRRGGSF
jgi:hypothetical protein